MYFEILSVLLTLLNPIYGYSLSSLQFSGYNSSLPPQITLGSGESLYLTWTPGKEVLMECKLIKPDASTVLLPNSAEKDIEFFGPSMDQGYCGARIIDVNVNQTGIWGLQARSKDSQYTTKTNVTVLAPLSIVNKTITSTGDEAVRINCGRDFPDVIQCELTSPTGKKHLYNKPCSTVVFQEQLIISQGLWLCKFSVLNYLTDFWASVYLKVKEIKNEVGYNDFPHKLVVYCNLANPKTMTRSCILTTPQGKEMNLGPGRGQGSYTYYGSSPSECGISIPKPIKKQDLGPWKCDLAIDSEKHFGGYVNIGNDLKMIPKVYVEKETVFWSKDDGILRLKCHVNYSIEYCWFLSPNGSIYHVENYKPSYSDTPSYWNFMFGDCVLQVNEPSSKNATGKWTCNIGLSGESLFEVNSHINVIYSDNLLMTPTDLVTAGVDESVDLLCKTGVSQIIKYCRFIRPDGQGLTISESLNTTEYSYLGSGYMYGDCGIKIHKLTDVDFGQWLCIMKIGNEEQQLNVILRKIDRGSWWLTAVGVVFGLGILVVGGYVGYSWFTRKTRSTSRNDISPLIERNEEEEDGMVGGRQTISNTSELRQRQRTNGGELHPGTVSWI